MISQKSQIRNLMGGWFSWELKILGLFLALISFSNLILTNNASALFVPTLSASVDQANLQVNGNQVINSTDKTTEIPFYFTVNSNNRTGYTVTLSTETENTALTNAGSTSGAKIDSISTNLSLNNFPNNTWGYEFGTSMNYTPIPALSAPAQIFKTTMRTYWTVSIRLKIGMKLSDNLESGNYTNKLVVSVVSNPDTLKAIMTEGPGFNTKLKALETTTNKIEHFKKSTVAPTASMNTINIEDEGSDYEIKLWLNPTDKTAYYYTEPEKVYLNEDMNSMFRNMSSLTTLDLSDFDTSQVTNMSYMFFNASSLTLLNLSNFDTSQVMNMDSIFRGMINLTTIDLSNFDTSKVEDMSSMFFDVRNLTTLDLSNFNTSRVTDMGFMFYGMSSLTSLNLSNFDTSMVTNMNAMFAGISKLTTLNLSSFDTSKVMDMGRMFSGMSNLTALDLSNFDTSYVTDMRSMFSSMSSLATLNPSNFDTSKVTNMNGMFYGMRSLTTLDLSNFDTSKVWDMEDMFGDMSSLTTLDLSNFDTSKVMSMNHMFFLNDKDKIKDKLEKIYVNNDFDTTNLRSPAVMFKNRNKLRGGNGSYLADPSTADKSWLRVDRPGVQGYFTRKP